MIQDVARRIAQEKVGPRAEQFDKSGEFPLENIRLLGENGLMGIEVPAEYGGAAIDPVAYVLAMVEIAAADAAHSTIMSVNNSRSEEHTSELQSLMRLSYAVFCSTKKKRQH